MAFREVSGRYDGRVLEEGILELWREHDVFRRTLELGRGRALWTFNEGPPTANGRPGIHHVLARTFKDLYPRYRTMRGFHVPRKAGWDTHGLPVEHEIEKELGIFDKSRIEQELGIAEFTRRCRESVMRYIGDWERMTERMGFWVDLENAYYTLDNDYIESVWSLLRTIWDKRLIYQGYKVVPYDPRIGATLSSHEVALGYQEVEDPSIYVRFKAADTPDTYLLAWTTTPWTLPSNLALAVHPGFEYAWVRHGEETLIMASALVESVMHERAHTIERVASGRELAGMRYERLFDYLPAEGDICRVLEADFVSLDDGTGIVHCAPAYGVDDLELGQRHGLPVVHGVGLDGYFKPEVTPVAGLFFKDADPVLTELLRSRGLLFHETRMLHNYPFGWRTGDPLMYYAKNAWYIRTTAVKDRMVELNRTINWTPESIRDGRFGNWLENNVDWALSRERFWGTPLPVWTDGEGDYVCIGSVQELEDLAGRSLRELDLHRPAVDAVSFVHPENGREYRRVPEVIDCWFDSGAMSYAQWHYPFENEDTFERHFPADYICEAIDQTRGWFYTLHAIATLVSDSVAYRNCVCLSHIVDKDGKKMSKSLGNIVDPKDVFDTVGVDALRWYFAARLAPEVQKRISVDIVAEVASSFINTFWNTYAFFVLYARLDGVDLTRDVPVARRPDIDRWALAALERTVRVATDALETYDSRRAGEAIESFVDQLSNWYVRRNRRRFWKSGAGDDKQAAYLTLYRCLDTVNRLTAPFMPFLAEEVYQNLVRGVEPDVPLSIHMTAWPEPDPEHRDDALISEFDAVMRVVDLGREARERSRIRVRQPLSRLLVRVPDEAAMRAVRSHASQIDEELNVKELEFLAPDTELVNYRIRPNLPVVGKRFGKRTPAVRETLATTASGVEIAGKVADGEPFYVEVNGMRERFEPDEVLVDAVSAEGYACAQRQGYLVALDTHLDETLLREGLARELVRTVQDARKQAGLEVSDRIRLRIEGSAGVEQAIAGHRELIMAETLSEEWGAPNTPGAYRVTHGLGDEHWTVTLERVQVVEPGGSSQPG